MEAATSDLHAGLSLRLAGEKRALIEQLNKDADEIEANIKSVDEKLTTGYYECENGHEISTSCGCALPGSHAFFHISDCVLNDFNKEQCPRPGCKKPMTFIKRDAMTGQEKTQSDRERDEAQTIAAKKMQSEARKPRSIS
ncbi:MAG TPA: hypothetical protein VK578_16560 [Edaphobacter sp.]|nr:hypothetical protein [Edaphobacter sp.]